MRVPCSAAGTATAASPKPWAAARCTTRLSTPSTVSRPGLPAPAARSSLALNAQLAAAGHAAQAKAGASRLGAFLAPALAPPVRPSPTPWPWTFCCYVSPSKLCGVLCRRGPAGRLLDGPLLATFAGLSLGAQAAAAADVGVPTAQLLQDLQVSDRSSWWAQISWLCVMGWGAAGAAGRRACGPGLGAPTHMVVSGPLM
jgi:hypothetical protein